MFAKVPMRPAHRNPLSAFPAGKMIDRLHLTSTALKYIVFSLMPQVTLSANHTEIPPISVSASEYWCVALSPAGGHPQWLLVTQSVTEIVPRDGNDGPWSSFSMQVGTPPQNLRLLPSSSGNAVWPVLPQGCDSGDTGNCGDLRGTLFLPNASLTWADIGLYGLVLTEEAGLGYSGNADFGHDNITLGWPGSRLPTLSYQVVEGIATKDFYIGSFGLNPQAVNISTLDDPQPSILGALVQQNKTPSTSWAYTAGAYYRQPTAFGSLTLGGYDTTRFIRNNVTFQFGPDISRDLLVPIQSITADTTSGPLLSTVIYAFIDSLVPHIWLPLAACQAFENTFGLTYNETAELYFVNDTLHEKLKAQNPNVTFSLGPASAGGSTVDITMQYGSFDLTADYPIVDKATRYFPLKKAENASQYTLGRAFLQDAYVIADYDRYNFSVSQAVFPNGSNAQQIVAIRRPIDSLSPAHRKILSTGAKIGIVVAAVISFLAFFAAIAKHCMRKMAKERSIEAFSNDRRIGEARPELEEEKIENTEQFHVIEMPVGEPNELTANEARRPELPAAPQSSVFELSQPLTELEGVSLAHAH